ncbi:MAG: hypothetical protein P8100_04345 [bacterium]
MFKRHHHNLIPALLLTIVVLLQNYAAYSQQNQYIELAMDSLVALSDSAYGLDTELSNGPIYYQKNLYAQGTPFYESTEWRPGSVTINGRLHTGNLMKYNIETDKLILLVTLRSGLSTSIILDPEHVEEFFLNNQHFIPAENVATDVIRTAYVHEVYKGDITLVASYRKNFINDYNAKTPYGKYSNRQSTYFISQNGSVTRISNKKTLLSLFEDHKRELHRYMKQQKFKFRKADTRQWHDLIAFCDNLESSQP